MTARRIWLWITFPIRAALLLAYALSCIPALAREHKQNEAALAAERGVS